MSTMQIEVVNVSVATVPTAKGSYQVADVAYKNKSFQDKLEGKKVMSFSNKDVFTTLSNAKFGDVFDVSRVKNDKGFWDWVGLSSGGVGVVAVPSNAAGSSPTGSVPSVVKTGTVTPKSNYETSEERAARQVLIVRQSSISSAVEFAVANKIKDEEEVLRLATRFVDYVFGKDGAAKEESVTATEKVPGSFDDFTDDIPY